jgi:DNA repair ATPase RecN
MSKSRKTKDGESGEPKDANELLTNAMLRSMIEELQQTKLSLVLQVKELSEKLEQERADHSDIYYYLNKKCDDNFEIIGHLEEQIINEQNSRETAEKAYEKKIEDMKSKFGFEEVRYQARIADLEDKNQSLKDFGERRDEMEKNLNALMTTLEAERQQYKRNMTYVTVICAAECCLCI